MSGKAARPALVIVDMLVDFFDPGIWPDSALPPLRKELCEQINACIRGFRVSSCPVVWIQQAFEPDLSDAFPHMRKTGKAYTIRGTAGAEILPELKPNLADPVVYKKRFSAFFETELAEKLSELNADAVVLCGVTTSWCIRSTATDAYQHDLEVILAKDCMAGFNMEDHRRDLGNVQLSYWESPDLSNWSAFDPGEAQILKELGDGLQEVRYTWSNVEFPDFIQLRLAVTDEEN